MMSSSDSESECQVKEWWGGTGATDYKLHEPSV